MGTSVFAARELNDGRVLITRAESPYEARLRLQTAGGHQEPLSFHSAIPNNPEHSRRVLAYDFAIGAGDSVDDVTLYQYLCRVADWRLDWDATRAKGRVQAESDIETDLPDEEVEQLYWAEEAVNRESINASVAYRISGAFLKMVGNTTVLGGDADYLGSPQRSARALRRVDLMFRLLTALALVSLLAGSPALHAADSPLLLMPRPRRPVCPTPLIMLPPLAASENPGCAQYWDQPGCVSPGSAVANVTAAERRRKPKPR